MNFRSLINKLYLFLNQKSGIIRSRDTSPIRRKPRVREYAPRTPKSVDTSDDACSDDFGGQYAPRTPRLQPPINRMRGQPTQMPISSLLSPVLHRFACQKYPEALVLFSSPEASPEIPKIPRSAVPESKLCPREVRFLWRSSRSAEDYYFCKS